MPEPLTDADLAAIEQSLDTCCCKGEMCDAWGCTTVGLLLAEVRQLRKRVAHIEQWYAVRWERLRRLIHDDARHIEDDACCILANATAAPDEPPTYDQQMARLRAELTQATACAKRLAEIARTGQHHGVFGGAEIEAASQAILSLHILLARERNEVDRLRRQVAEYIAEED